VLLDTLWLLCYLHHDEPQHQEAVQLLNGSNSRLLTHNYIVEEYFHNRGYRSNYIIAKEWMVSNTVEELLSFFKSRAYGLCWRVSDETFHRVMDEFEEFFSEHYGSLATELSSEAKLEI